MSEFSYGFALTNELIHRHDVALTGAPRFPTQREEGRVGGYDVALPRQGLPLFLQFKRCECLVRRNANEAAALGLPYFRMWLMARRHSDQHDLLLDLEGQGNEVYYAAPRFHLMAELNDAYLAGRVASLTSFIAPSWVGVLPDDDSHYVAIRRDDASRLLCSKEPRKIEVMSSEAVLGERVRKAARERGTVIDEGYLRELAAFGWEIGSHTRNHPRLTKLDGAELELELAGSREDLNSRLDAECRTIAYPYGDVDVRVAEAARLAGYVAGAALSSRLAPLGPLRSPRVGIYRNDRQWRFRLKTAGAIE